jgi:hypothetical protein
MSYFGVITCGSCGQKLTITPDQVRDDARGYGYYCRRCQHNGVLAEDFQFKHPTKKNLGVLDAMRATKVTPGWLSKLANFLFSKDP